jgi:hypothetical protein
MTAPRLDGSKRQTVVDRNANMSLMASKSRQLCLLGLVLVSCIVNGIYWSSVLVGDRWGDVELSLPSLSGLSSSSVSTLASTLARPATPWSVFYNVYLPLRNATHALTIVEEQLEQMSSSYGATRPGFAPVTVHVNTIGDPIGAEMVRQYCAAHTNLHCVHMQHYADGNFEDVTLSRVHQFCRNAEMDDTPSHDPVVVYLHSKGTYHPSEMNDRWRHFMTSAAMGEECLEFQGLPDRDTPGIAPPHLSSTDNPQCNVCGFMFYPIWTPFFPGNVWTAKCSYIRKLMPPQVFKKQSDSTADKAVALMREGRFTMNLLSPYLEEGGYLGRERFADEHWVGSHPSLVPCDLAPRPQLMKWVHPRLRKKFGAPPFKWSLAPRHGINEDWLFLQGIKKKYRLVADPDWRHREFFLLPGALWKWITWYDAVPPDSSYVWKWFPDGLEWLKRAQTLGTQGLLTYLTHDTYLHPPDEPSSVHPFQIATTDKRGEPVRTFFYHIQIPVKNVHKAVFRRVVYERLEAIGYLSPGATVFFNTVGDASVLDVEKLKESCEEIYGLNCVNMEQLDAGMDIKTMSRVYDFCRIHSSLRVGYVHTLGGTERSSTPRNEERLLQTKAIATNLCWKSTQADCDVCSLKTTSRNPIWGADAVGNRKKVSKRRRNFKTLQTAISQPDPIPAIWTASCAYIASLDSPNDFASKTAQVNWSLSQTSGQRWILSDNSANRCKVEVETVAKLAQLAKNKQRALKLWRARQKSTTADEEVGTVEH